MSGSVRGPVHGVGSGPFFADVFKHSRFCGITLFLQLPQAPAMGQMLLPGQYHRLLARVCSTPTYPLPQLLFGVFESLHPASQIRMAESELKPALLPIPAATREQLLRLLLLPSSPTRAVPGRFSIRLGHLCPWHWELNPPPG